MLNKKLLSAAVQASVGPSTDPDFKQTVLLLHGDGTNGAQNNTFIDGSTNNFTTTRNGNTTQGTFTPFSQPAGYWSNYFDGAGDYLTVASSTAFGFGIGDFTIEAWCYPTATGTDRAITDFRTTGNVNGTFYLNGSGQLSWWNGSTNFGGTGTAVTLNSWNHVVLCRSSGTTRAFLNGVQQWSTTTSLGTFPSSVPVGIGAASWDGSSPFTGYISNVRVVKGTAVYTAAFTPSTTPLTAVSGTELLTCQDNRFRDGSSNNFAVTRNGDVRVTAFSPFAPTAAYSPSVNGGSGYFDGTGDYLEIADNAALEIGSSDFTIEAWIYPTKLPAFDDGNPIISKYDTSSQRSWNLVLDNTTTAGTQKIGLWLSTNGTSLTNNITAAYTTPLNTWTHVAAVRDGNTVTIYINGTVLTSSAFSGTAFDSTAVVQIGKQSGGADTFGGYISNARVVKGSAVYTAAFTPPTAPLTAITNTSLLLNFTNAGIIDSTGKNVLETVGNAQLDTTVKKYGTGSMEFDGSGDYLRISQLNPDLLIGTGAFTIEFWFNTTSSTRYAQFVGNEATTNGFSILINNASSTSGDIAVYNGANGLINSATSASYRDGNWHHLALVRDSNGSRLYLNGTQQGSTNAGEATTSFEASLFRWAIGTNLQFSGRDYAGYIDDLRITKGVARYTTNFTPPTAPFEDL